ncbi:hypothetical protein FB192DRAFT_1351006 [Mucor lusitanicus]|uniref:Uncharacterized protein n=1 Tax=Mucor circinelloides f. lusitanicus TaxID=29924 RepID=A0A8H4BSB2_MUCCL|nr:hypothetical protein FB192DRAFT_1351006 [Mucor lusitanicus]
MEYTDKTSLKVLLESNRENEQQALAVESIQLVNQHEVYNIVEKCTDNVVHLRDLFVQHLKLDELRDKNLSSFTITSDDKTSYTIAIKQKTISLDAIDLLHRVFPNLKSISLYMFNLRYDEEENVLEANADNTVSHIDMTFNTFPVNMSKLIMYIFDSYGKRLTTLKIKKGGNISSKDKKWEDLSQEVVHDGELLLKHNYQLPKLETVELCHFYQKFPASAFVEALLKSNCALQHAAFIGVSQSDSIIMHLKKMATESLKTLALDTYDFPNLKDLGAFPLESLSLRWADGTAIDINAALDALPHLKDLDLGYDVDYNQLEEGKTALKQKASLQSITLHHVIIDRNILDKLAADMPTLSKLTLSSCKFGSSRVSTEEEITLLNYQLKELVLDNCALYCSKKDSIEKRQINKLNINIDSDCKYTAEIVSKARASMAKFEHVSNVKNQFAYSCFSETVVRPTNTLAIMLKSIETIKLDTMGLKAVEFESDSISHPRQTVAHVDDNADYDGHDNLVEDVLEVSSVAEQVVVKEQVIEEEGDEEILEEIVEEQVVEEQIIQEVDMALGDNSQKDEGSTAAEDSKEEEDSEYQMLTVSEIKRIKKIQEMDKDFAVSSETDSTTSEESETDEEEDEEERALPRRKSSRFNKEKSPTATSIRELRKRKRVSYSSSTDSDQDSNVESSEYEDDDSDDDEPVRSAREKKRMRKFMDDIRFTKPIIKLYPSKSLEGYYR